MKTTTEWASVRNFFDGRKYVYANPHTENYTANFYGDTPICRLCQRDVIQCINYALSWDEGYTMSEATEIILSELQYDKPDREA